MNDIDSDNEYDENNSLIEFDYIDIVNLVHDFNTNGDDLELECIKKNIDDVILDLLLEEDEINDIIEYTWINMMEPLIDNEVQSVLRKNKEKIKINFSIWMFNNTLFGKEFNYINKLKYELENYSEILSDSPYTNPNPVIALNGDE
jgi:hypothetical protein